MGYGIVGNFGDNGEFTEQPSSETHVTHRYELMNVKRRFSE